MEVLIPAPADCEVRSVITLGRTRLDGQQVSCRSSAGRCLIIHPTARTSLPVISIFSYTSRNSCPVSVSVLRMTERRRWLSHSGSNPRRQTSTTQVFKSWSHGMTNVSIQVANMLKNSWTLAVSVAINISMKLCFVSVNGPRETYFEDAPRTLQFVHVLSMLPGWSTLLNNL